MPAAPHLGGVGFCPSVPGTRSRLGAILHWTSRPWLPLYSCHRETGTGLTAQPWGRWSMLFHQLHAHPRSLHNRVYLLHTYYVPSTEADRYTLPSPSLIRRTSPPQQQKRLTVTGDVIGFARPQRTGDSSASPVTLAREGGWASVQFNRQL